jgi:hypothetical protein
MMTGLPAPAAPDDILAFLTELFRLLTPIGTLMVLAIQYHIFKKVDVLRQDVRTVELATNSMKDALVARTAEASHAAGMVAGAQAEQEHARAIAIAGKEAATVPAPRGGGARP